MAIMQDIPRENPQKLIDEWIYATIPREYRDLSIDGYARYFSASPKLSTWEKFGQTDEIFCLFEYKHTRQIKDDGPDAWYVAFSNNHNQREIIELTYRIIKYRVNLEKLHDKGQIDDGLYVINVRKYTIRIHFPPDSNHKLQILFEKKRKQNQRSILNTLVHKVVRKKVSFGHPNVVVSALSPHSAKMLNANDFNLFSDIVSYLKQGYRIRKFAIVPRDTPPVDPRQAQIDANPTILD